MAVSCRCPVEPHQVTVVENGVAQRARFSWLLFLFHGTYEEIYLHCGLSLCDRSSALCRPVSKLQPPRTGTRAVEPSVALRKVLEGLQIFHLPQGESRSRFNPKRRGSCRSIVLEEVLRVLQAAIWRDICSRSSHFQALRVMRRFQRHLGP